MSAKQLEAYLFYKMNMVAIDLGHRIELCDLLVKNKSGMFSKKRITNVGYFSLFRHHAAPQTQVSEASDNPDGDFSEYEERIKEQLDAIRSNPGEEGSIEDPEGDTIVLSHKDYVDHTEIISSGSGLGAKILHFFTGQCGVSDQIECTMVNPCYHRLTDKALHDLFIGDPERAPLWRPNIEKIRQSSDLKEENGAVEIWIVREKVYCDKLCLNSVQQRSADLSATVDGNLTLGANAGSNATARRQTLRLHPIGFKPFRLFYDYQGNLLKWRPDSGNTVADVRAGDESDGDSFHDQYKDFHLADFFVEPPDAVVSDLINLSLQPVYVKISEGSEDGSS